MHKRRGTIRWAVTASIAVIVTLARCTVAVAERLPLRAYTMLEGLPHDRVQKIVRDSEGFLWFCTVGGLSRFDGHGFKTFGVDDGLPSQSANHFLQDRTGQLWVALNGGGIARFLRPSEAAVDSGTGAKRDDATRVATLFGLYPVGDEVKTGRVNVLHQDRTGHIWAGTDAGLFRLDYGDPRGRFERVPFQAGPIVDRETQVWAFAESEESLWIGTSRGLARLGPRPSHLAIRPVNGSDNIYSLAVDREGRLWLGHESGLFAINSAVPASSLPQATTVRRAAATRSDALGCSPAAAGEICDYSVLPEFAGRRVNAVVQAGDGPLWVGMYPSGLVRIVGRRIQNYTAFVGLEHLPVWTLAEDRENNLWIGTQDAGAVKMARRGFVGYGPEDGFQETRVTSIFEEPDGALLLTGADWRIHRYDGQRFTSVRPNLPPDIVHSSWRLAYVPIRDRAGGWWVPSQAGLLRFDPVARLADLATARPRAVYKTGSGLPGNDVRSVFEDTAGDMWVVTAEGGGTLSRWQRAGGRFETFTSRDGLPAFNLVRSFAEVPGGSLWLGFFDGGVARFDGSRFTWFGSPDGVPEGAIDNLYVDRRRRLWIGSSAGGVARLDDPASAKPRFLRHPTRNALLGGTVTSLTEDPSGRIYVGGLGGLDILDGDARPIRHYTSEDGLFRGSVGVAFRDRHASLWFGGFQGLARFIPEPDRPLVPPPVFINSLRVAGIPRPLSALGERTIPAFTIESHQNRIEIAFGGLGFGLGERLSYQYRLAGAAGGWGPVTADRSIYYDRLSAGTYQFEVLAVSVTGAVSDTPATVGFVILAPLWQRGWFLMLMAFALGIALLAAHRSRVARLLELERMRMRIATDLHDDIGTSLSRMAILSEVVKRQSPTTSPDAMRLLGEIGDTARSLVDAMSEIVWSVDPRRDDVHDVLVRTRQFAADLFQGTGVDWRFDAPDGLDQIRLAPERRRHLYLILKEALANIVRHARCASATCTVAMHDHRLNVEIRDDGRGFSRNAECDLDRRRERGHGLRNMGERAAALGGTLTIESAPDRGTRLTLDIPLR
jgi:signal transduction histidine kinase/ligand-binding sensor domain-containing protein